MGFAQWDRVRRTINSVRKKKQTVFKFFAMAFCVLFCNLQKYKLPGTDKAYNEDTR